MDGIIVVNKEKGYTSRDVVNIVSKAYGTKKVGHTGTLDPLAQGVLIVCLNKALKVAEFITTDDKEYLATVMLGIETDTLDITGNVVSTCDKVVSKADVEKVLSGMIGKIKQEVPLYSAVKVKGKKLYEYARENIAVELPVKEVYVYDLKLVGDLFLVDGMTCFRIKCRVSKGCYIRSLIRDIGRALSTYATMSELIRTEQAGVPLSYSSSIDDVKLKKSKIYKIDEIINLPKVCVSGDLLKQIKNGRLVDSFFSYKKAFIVDTGGQIVAIYENLENNRGARLVKMINNQ